MDFQNKLHKNSRIANHPIANRFIAKPDSERSKAAANATLGVVQRVIRSAPNAFGGQMFVRRGRSGRHSSAANKRALRAILLDRQANPNQALRHVNNEYEAARSVGLPTPPLHIAHHISDENVQQTIVNAVNNHNRGMPGSLVPILNMIHGINPAAAPAGLVLPPQFLGTANSAYAQAVNQFNALMNQASTAPGNMGQIPHNGVFQTRLTIMASAIANSPMNLHYGLGQTNMSIGHHGDPNSHAVAALPPAPLNRQLSWRSEHMRQRVGNANLDYRTHATAYGLHGTVAAAQAGIAAVGPLPPHVVHSSGSSNHFTALQ